MVDYHELAADYAQHRQVHPQVVRNLVEVGQLDGSASVLEVGCGTANYPRTLAHIVGCSCVGIDPSDEMLSRARIETEVIRFENGTGENLDVPNAIRLRSAVVNSVVIHPGDCCGKVPS